MRRRRVQQFLRVGLLVIFGPLTTVRGEEPPALWLPEPGGEFDVGTAGFLWGDESREEKATDEPADHRRIAVRLWFPSDGAGADEAAGEGDAAPAMAPYIADLEPFRRVWGPKTLGRVERVRSSHSVLDAPLSDRRERYPLVLFSHGWGEMAASHQILLEALASHGYVVAGIDHPYMGAIPLPGTGVTEPTEEHFEGIEEIRAFYGADVRFALDRLVALDRGSGRFAGRLDLGAVAAIGHSSGFVAASAACLRDARIRACANYDAPGFSAEALIGMRQPLLWVRADRAEAPPSEFLERLLAPVYEVRLDGGRHDSFTDWPYLQAGDSEERREAVRLLSRIERYTLGFLDLHLRSRLHPPG